MTIILSAVLPNVVIQASDRLVTFQGSYRVHDRAANKSVVYIGVNCRLVLGYTGDAYVGDIPTDEWIVEQLYGRRLTGGDFEMKLPPVLLNAHEVVTTLADRAQDAGIADQVAISVAGYQMTRRGEVGRIWFIEHGRIYHEHQPANPDLLLECLIMPRGWETGGDRRQFEQEIRTAQAGEYPQIMARAVQRIGAHSPGVGEDVMVALLLRDQRYMEIGLHLAPNAGGEQTDLYSPAVILPGVAMSPARLIEVQSCHVIGPGYIREVGGQLEGEGEHMLVLNPNRPLGNGFAFREHIREPPPS